MFGTENKCRKCRTPMPTTPLLLHKQVFECATGKGCVRLVARWMMVKTRLRRTMQLSRKTRRCMKPRNRFKTWRKRPRRRRSSCSLTHLRSAHSQPYCQRSKQHMRQNYSAISEDVKHAGIVPRTHTGKPNWATCETCRHRELKMKKGKVSWSSKHKKGN